MKIITSDDENYRIFRACGECGADSRIRVCVLQKIANTWRLPVCQQFEARSFSWKKVLTAAIPESKKEREREVRTIIHSYSNLEESCWWRRSVEMRGSAPNRESRRERKLSGANEQMAKVFSTLSGFWNLNKSQTSCSHRSESLSTHLSDERGLEEDGVRWWL